jgi:membrane fusion protein, multidrug efflux system
MRGFLYVLVLICSLAVGACSRVGAEANGTNPPGRRAISVTQAVPVTEGTVMIKPMPVAVSTIGTAEPLSTVEVRAQVTVQLSRVGFDEGQEVQAGRLLFALDARPFEVALQQAQAILAKESRRDVTTASHRPTPSTRLASCASGRS